MSLVDQYGVVLPPGNQIAVHAPDHAIDARLEISIQIG